MNHLFQQIFNESAQFKLHGAERICIFFIHLFKLKMNSEMPDMILLFLHFIFVRIHSILFSFPFSSVFSPIVLFKFEFELWAMHFNADNWFHSLNLKTMHTFGLLIKRYLKIKKKDKRIVPHMQYEQQLNSSKPKIENGSTWNYCRLKAYELNHLS